jgi:hypothetical protein
MMANAELVWRFVVRRDLVLFRKCPKDQRKQTLRTRVANLPGAVVTRGMLSPERGRLSDHRAGQGRRAYQMVRMLEESMRLSRLSTGTL